MKFLRVLSLCLWPVMLSAQSVKQVTVACPSPTLALGARMTCTPIVRLANGRYSTTKTIEWASSNPNVAIVSAKGIVSTIRAGSVTIGASSGGAKGEAALTVTSTDTATTPPPPVAVASVTVSFGGSRLIVGQTTNATAVVRDSAGDVLTNRQVIWSTLTPSFASVSPASGLVTGLAAGTATIRASVESKVADATLVIRTQGDTSTTPADTVTPPSSPGHPNEPAGFTQLSPTLTGDIVPPTQAEYVAGSPNEIGWIQSPTITKVVDSSSPEDSQNVLQIPFPAGGGNGGAPGWAYTMSSTNPQHWPSGPTEIYISYWYKVSPNFPASLNAEKMMYGQIGNNENGTVGNKLVYLINGNADFKFSGAVDASPVVFAPNAGTPYNSPMVPTLTVQGIVSVDGTVSSAINLNQNWIGDPTQWKYQSRGVWHHHEVYAKSNTPGNEDGTVKVWFDGSLIINYTARIKWSNNPTRDKWWTMFWDPVYNNMIPLDASNAYHRLKNLYVSGKP